MYINLKMTVDFIFNPVFHLKDDKDIKSSSATLVNTQPL